jgi:hypothetical protein
VTVSNGNIDEIERGIYPAQSFGLMSDIKAKAFRTPPRSAAGFFVAKPPNVPRLAKRFCEESFQFGIMAFGLGFIVNAQLVIRHGPAVQRRIGFAFI